MRTNDTQTVWAPLAEIAISERTLRSLSAATVERYRAWLEQGREAPAIRIAQAGDVYVVRDGRHRVAAALAAGHRFIEAKVQPIVGLLQRLGRSARSLLGGASPAAQTTGMRFFWKNASLAPRRSGFDPRRLHSLCARLEADARLRSREHLKRAASQPGRGALRTASASVVSTASTRLLYGRSAGSNPAGGSFERP
jgi:hypothetical protein